MVEVMIELPLGYREKAQPGNSIPKKSGGERS